MTGENKNIVNVEAIEKAAEIFGSISKFAIALNTNYGSVYKWVKGKNVPNPISCMKIEKATKGLVKKEDILPDFNWKDFKKILS